MKTETSKVTIDSEGNVLDVLNTVSFSGWDLKGSWDFNGAGSNSNHNIEETSPFIRLQLNRENESIDSKGMVITEYLADYGQRLRDADEIASPLLVINNLMSPGGAFATAVGIFIDIEGPSPASIMGPSPNPTDHNYTRINIRK